MLERHGVNNVCEMASVKQPQQTALASTVKWLQHHDRSTLITEPSSHNRRRWHQR